MARLNRGRLVPHRLSPDDRRTKEVAAELCELYAAHVGRPRVTLERELAVREEELGPGLDARRGFRIVRALAKLFEERVIFLGTGEHGADSESSHEDDEDDAAHPETTTP